MYRTFDFLAVPTSTRQLPRARVNRLRAGLIILVIGAAAIFVMWAKKADVVDEHRRIRQLVLHYTLDRTEDPVVILGDSIVEASTLPRSICGHAIVNAGLSGASTTSDLGSWLSQALGSKQAALIVVSLGTNDALVSAPTSKRNFADRYGALLEQLSKLTPRLDILEIPPVETRGRMTAEMHDEAMATINDYNAALPDVAARSGATLVALPAMPRPYTIDGVHLSSGGYQAWGKAALQAAAAICS
jgi:lysophospholipase L1-like esterase